MVSCLYKTSTDNYPLNVKLFKLFSPSNKLETRVPHPCDIHISLFLTFDFVVLKTIRKNWLNQQCDSKLFSYPDFNCHASFRDIRMLYNSERDCLAKLAQRFTFKSVIHQFLNVKMSS